MNTHCAAPGEALGTTSVRERYYLGPCRSKQIHEETIQELAQFNDEIMEYIKDFEYLDDKERVDMIEYLGSYVKDSRESGLLIARLPPPADNLRFSFLCMRSSFRQAMSYSGTFSTPPSL